MNDRFTIRAVVVLLGVIAVFGMALMGWLALEEKDIPAELVAISSASAGALSALLARTSLEGPSNDGFGG